MLGKRAVVIGAGMGGMAAAAALSEAFDEVVVLERDAVPDQPGPRPGTPQGMHGHVLLTGGLSALRELLPGFDQALVEAGAETIRTGLDFRMEQGPFTPFPQRDLGWDFYSASRALFEHTVRQRLGTIANVTLRSNVRVEEILSSEDDHAVTGVSVVGRDNAAEVVTADLVVDSTCHGTATLKLLDRLGLPRPAEDLISVDLGYASALFEKPADAQHDFKMLLTTPRPPSDTKSGLLLTIEDGKWMLTLIGRGEQIPPGDWPGFMAFLDTLRTPSIKQALADATPIGRVWRYRFAANIRRRFEKLTAFPANLLPFGDVICRTNPAAGQGMSVAANEARQLKHLLKRRADADQGLAGIAPEFLDAAQHYVDHAWSMVAAQDFQYPGTVGDKRFADYSGQIFNAELFQIASEDAELHRLWQQVAHILEPMSSLAEALAVRRQARIEAA